MPISRHLLPKTLRIEDRDKVWTRSTFVLLIDYFHHWLDERGIGRGDVVILSSNNAAEVYALFFALMERGAVFFGTHTRAFYEIQRYRDCGAKLAVVEDDDSQTTAAGVGIFGLVEKLPILNIADLVNVVPVTEFAEVLDTERAIMAATSGTTGEPVVIAHTHDSILFPSMNAKSLFFTPEDRALCYLNLNHLGFLTVFTLPIFFIGCTVVLATQSDIENMAPLIARSNITKMLCFPWMLTQIMQPAERDGHTIDLTGIEVITGGQMISPLFMTQCFAFGVHAIHNAYGMTEVPPPVMVKSNYAKGFDPKTYDPLYLGIPVDGNEVLVHRTGVLGVRSRGIDRHLDGRAMTEESGFILTSDRGVKTKEGYFNGGRHIVSKRHGERIVISDSIWAIESMMRREPAAQVLCSFVVRRSEWPNPLFVCMIQAAVAEKYNMTLETINETITHLLDPFHYLDILLVMDDLPNNGLKIDVTVAKATFNDLLDRHLAGEVISGLYINS